MTASTSPTAARSYRPARLCAEFGAPGGVADVLVRIVEQRRRRYPATAAADEVVVPAPAQTAAEPDAFAGALRSARSLGRSAIIAEVKMGSPKLGDLRDRVDPGRQARVYRDHGAAALSVVVEPDHFHGSYDLLRRCVGDSGLPAIAKDFVVDERQLDEAAKAGAAAMLLIAALYEADELQRLATGVRARGMVPLVETHTPTDVERLGEVDWELVGVNNRDLRTFAVDLQHSVDLLPSLPEGALRVAESGIAGRAEIERLEAAGFDAFLIGESLLLAEDPASQLRGLLGEDGP